MNGLSKEKKQQLILVLLITVVIVAGVWFGLITAQQASLAAAEKKSTEAREKIDKGEKTIKLETNILERLETARLNLQKREETMASGDLYQWFLNKMSDPNRTKTIYNFFSDPPVVDEAKLIPKFPYRTATYKVKLSGFYHDVGKFLADIENDYPYARMQNLEINPPAQGGEEKLNFTFEFVTLFHTNRAVSLK